MVAVGKSSGDLRTGRPPRVQLLLGFSLCLSGPVASAAATAAAPAPAPTPTPTTTTTTLRPDVVSSYLSKLGERVLVVAAGDWQTSKNLALAVEQAIIESGNADTIESGASLGEIATLSDQELVSRLSQKRLDEIIIVRAVPGAPSLGNVRFYDPLGTLLAEFQFGPGLDLLPRVQAEIPSLTNLPVLGPGLGNAAGDYDEEPLSMKRSRRFFNKAHLEVRDIRMISWKQRWGRWRKKTKIILAATQGTAEELVPWELFYELVNRPDLLLQYHERQVSNYHLVVAGGIMAAAAVPILIAAGATSTQDEKRIPYSLSGIGCGLALTGAISMLIGAFRSPHPVGREQLEQLAQAHNRKLPQPPPAPPSLPPPPTVE